MKEDFSFDLVAGLAVAAMLVPQVEVSRLIQFLTPSVACLCHTGWPSTYRWPLYSLGIALVAVSLLTPRPVASSHRLWGPRD